MTLLYVRILYTDIQTATLLSASRPMWMHAIVLLILSTCAVPTAAPFVSASALSSTTLMVTWSPPATTTWKGTIQKLSPVHWIVPTIELSSAKEGSSWYALISNSRVQSAISVSKPLF